MVVPVESIVGGVIGLVVFIVFIWVVVRCTKKHTRKEKASSDRDVEAQQFERKRLMKAEGRAGEDSDARTENKAEEQQERNRQSVLSNTTSTINSPTLSVSELSSRGAQHKQIYTPIQTSEIDPRSPTSIAELSSDRQPVEMQTYARIPMEYQSHHLPPQIQEPMLEMESPASTLPTEKAHADVHSSRGGTVAQPAELAADTEVQHESAVERVADVKRKPVAGARE